MSDIAIPAEVVAKIRIQLGARAKDLCLHERNNELVLQGTVPSYYVKQLAQHLALDLLGTIPFVNEIQVVPRL